MAGSHHKHKSAARRRFIRSAVLSAGFLSGLWAHLGFNPGNIVQDLLEAILVSADPAHVAIITFLFVVIPIAITIIGVLAIYRKAGLWGFAATGLAYLAGLWLDVWSVFLLVVAVIIAVASVRR